ncbi:MAG: hypothetical protein P4L50_14540 [Anaerolineaceae bacterium]|nr:hypothetical protein [Anaerolineaceae bacterium]
MKNVELECIQRVVTSPEVKSRVATVQAHFVGGAQGCFSQEELDHLRIVIRLTLEFRYYLQAACTHVSCMTYVSESIFSGIESYCVVTRAYKPLGGATDSKIEWDALSLPSISEQFNFTFVAFDQASDFEDKCRLLLDLFKIQIVWAAISYD